MEGLQQHLTENSYFRQEELSFAECDRFRRARVSTLLSLAAAAAGHDYDARGLPYETLYAMGEVFLLSRFALNIHSCPQAGDILDLTTWENGVRGAHMQRVFELADREGRLRVSAKSDWILVDPVERRILRPGSFTAKPITVCPKAIDCPECRKLPPLGAEGEELGVRQVRWSDLDGNGHLYSGNYPDIVWDFLPADLQDRTPRQFFINYSKEATLGQDLLLTGFREGERYRMEGRGPEGVCFSALCVF